MKPAHPTAKLLRDLKRHVLSTNKGAEPFASGLRAIGETAWQLLNLRGVEWTALGQKTEFQYIVRTHVASTDGVTESYTTPARPPKTQQTTPYQQSMLKLAQKSIKQYIRTCRWVFDKFCEALDDPQISSRNRLRCLTGKAAFDALVCKRIDEIEALKAGRSKVSDSRLGEFVERHGGAFLYRDHLYVNRGEVLNAMLADTTGVAVDHDLIVAMYEQAFPPEGFDEQKFDELERYMRSKDHSDALKVAEDDIAKGKLSRNERTLHMILRAERKLAALDEPLPPALYRKLGLTKEFLRVVMQGKPKTKEGVRAALREKLYTIRPQRRPRKKTPLV